MRTLRIDDTLKGVMIDTAKTTSLVFIILLGAAMLTAAFRAFGGEELVKEFLTTLPGGFWTQFVIVMAVIFLLGFFLDFIEIAVVVVPIVAPILLMDPSANITAVWLGVMIGLNIQTSFLTPPFGFALFYLRGVAPKEVRTIDIYKGVIPFIGLQLIALVIVGNLPPLVNYLPSRISLLSETAPPPVNPRLQFCMEEYVAGEFRDRRDEIAGAIKTAQSLPLDSLPEDYRDDLGEAFVTADGMFELMAAITAAEAAVAEAEPAYRPLHVQVRRVEADVRKIEERIKKAAQRLGRLQRNDPESAAIARLEVRIAEDEAEVTRLLETIPEDWEPRHEVFKKLTTAETKARRDYRRASDDAFESIGEIRTILAATDRLAALDADVAALESELTSSEPPAVVERIEAVRSALREAEAGKDTVKGLSDARKAMRKDPDPVKAAEALAEARAALAADVEWRRRAAAEVLPGLDAYAEAVQDTIGLRQLDRLPREQALYVASCNASHRDISLNF